ncbi:hypothetical protein C8J57DRAFT_1601199 [Mycena rebaudengoi]|nr:hypothetical protein C8J57DRAFT_1601199 [Mycena rebaudengoi]
MCATHSVLDPRVTPDWTCQELNGLCSSVISGVGAKYCIRCAGSIGCGKKLTNNSPNIQKTGVYPPYLEAASLDLMSSSCQYRSSRGATLTVYTARRGRGGKWGNSEVKELEEMEMIWRWARTISPKKTKKCASMPRKFTSARNEDERRGSDGVMGDRLRGPTGARLAERGRVSCPRVSASGYGSVTKQELGKGPKLSESVTGAWWCQFSGDTTRWRGSPGVTERDRVRGENFIASQGRVLVNLECRRGVWQTAMVRAHSLSRGRKWECRTRFGMVECKEKVVQNKCTHTGREDAAPARWQRQQGGALAAAAEVQQRRVCG